MKNMYGGAICWQFFQTFFNNKWYFNRIQHVTRVFTEKLKILIIMWDLICPMQCAQSIDSFKKKDAFIKKEYLPFQQNTECNKIEEILIVQFTHGYEKKHCICNKFIEVNFCVGCMVWQPNRLFQDCTFVKYWWDTKLKTWTSIMKALFVLKCFKFSLCF